MLFRSLSSLSLYVSLYFSLFLALSVFPFISSRNGIVSSPFLPLSLPLSAHMFRAERWHTCFWLFGFPLFLIFLLYFLSSCVCCRPRSVPAPPLLSRLPDHAHAMPGHAHQRVQKAAKIKKKAVCKNTQSEYTKEVPPPSPYSPLPPPSHLCVSACMCVSYIAGITESWRIFVSQQPLNNRRTTSLSNLSY